MKCKYKVIRPSGRSIMVHPRSKFSLYYEDGKVTRAAKDTLGILVFKTLLDAQTWINHWYNEEGRKYIIKRVVPVGRGFTPKWISFHIDSESLKSFYNIKEEHREFYLFTSETPIEGTMCYPAVKVINTAVSMIK